MIHIEFKTIDGNYTNKNPVGYCKYKKAYLTLAQMKTHRCTSRQCKRLIKRNHEYWNRKSDKKKD